MHVHMNPSAHMLLPPAHGKIKRTGSCAHLLGQLDASSLELSLLLQCGQPPGLLHLPLARFAFSLFTPVVCARVRACVCVRGSVNASLTHAQSKATALHLLCMYTTGRHTNDAAPCACVTTRRRALT